MSDQGEKGFPHMPKFPDVAPSESGVRDSVLALGIMGGCMLPIAAIVALGYVAVHFAFKFW